MKRPVEPLGCDVQAHKKADKRRTWDPQSCYGWNVGTAMDHHRCFTVWIKKTRAERFTDTVFLKHKYLTNPKLTPEDKVVASAQILTQEIKGKVTGESEDMEALGKVAEIFETIAKRKSRKQKERHNNEHAIRLPRRTNAKYSRVAEQNAQNPRVDETPPRVDAITGLTVTYPTEVVVNSSK